MKPKVIYLPIKKLKPHERISTRRVQQLIKYINGRGLFTTPIIVEKNSKTILDGHHRVAALRLLGCSLVPAIMVDYRSQYIKVYLRHNHLPMELLKDLVIKTASNGVILPHKTTRHLLATGRVRNINCGLASLR
ncbi:MAG: ParB N-terminal domain-containing protein [Patescibacteria group bacterium]